MNSPLLYSALTAWASWAAVVCAILIVVIQTRSARRLTCLQLFIQISAQYDSPDMQQIRRRLARTLLEDPQSLHIEETLLVFFENISILDRRNLLDKELVWNTFIFDILRYWYSAKHFVEHSRKMHADPTIYEEFEQLALRNIGATRSPFGTKVARENITDEDCRSFLQYESMLGGSPRS